MQKSEILVIETLKFLEGKKDALQIALQKIAEISRKSPGCLQYDIFESNEAGQEILVLMRFSGIKELRDHENSDYIAEFVKQYENILYDAVTVSEWKK